MHGDGLTKRDFIFDEDFNSAFLKVLQKGKTGQIYHFSSGSLITIKKITEIICKLKNVRFKDIVYNTHERKGKDKYYHLNSKVTSKNLNWKPRNNLMKGLIKTIKHYDDL